MTKQERMKFHELQAQWWIAYATTGACKSDNIANGYGTQLTDKEKVKRAMNTAQNHLGLFMEVSENWK